MVPNKKIKAYIMYPFSGADHCLCIYHYTAREAKKFGLGQLDYDDYKRVTCVRYPLADVYGAVAPSPMIEADELILRTLGWVSEEHGNCPGCGLSHMGLEAQQLCNACDYCEKCGHGRGCNEL